MSNPTRDYFERRKQEELALADRAKDPSIALIHRRFAEHYDKAAKGEPDTMVKVSQVV